MPGADMQIRNIFWRYIPYDYGRRFRKGITVEIDGNVWSVVDFQHVKPGKGAAFVRTKLKNVMTGAVLERTFNPSDKYPRLISRPRRCNICITMASCITSWIPKPMSSCP